MKLLIASNNQGKIAEIKEILGDLFDAVHSLKEMGIHHDVQEDGATFLENAVKKAEAFVQYGDMYVLADDSGLCVDALKGAPGVFSARFSGPNATDAQNNVLLLERMKGIPDGMRGAAFKCCVALAGRNTPTITAQGVCRGHILHEGRGESGFGYDPLFYVEAYNATFAELGTQEKNAISHRKRALEALKEKLKGCV
ncbi:MAG: XTP/dITP diphosphatase [Christensenellales bacterium]|jgi:XTP/dITP diphosphohydrolase